MTKAAIWNQLKTEYEYSSSLLNKLYGVTYQQASKELLESILEQLQKEVGQGVNEDLSSDVVEVTGNDLITDTNAPINQDKVNSSEVNYIVTLTDYPQVVIKDDYNPKELTEVTEQQLVSSIYTDKTTAEMMFPGSYYQVLEVNPNNIKQQLMQHYNLEETSDIVATVTSDNKFKGIPVEHVTKYDIGLDYPETINDVLLTKFPNYWLVNKSEDVLQFNSFSNAVKHIKEWLGVKQQHVPSTETGNYHYSQMQLTPKIYLFTAMTEFVFLMECFLGLMYTFNEVPSAPIKTARNYLFSAWDCLINRGNKYYVYMPTICDSTYGILLRIHNQAMKQSSLERKSIYA